jgi:hypothetical protein
VGKVTTGIDAQDVSISFLATSPLSVGFYHMPHLSVQKGLIRVSVGDAQHYLFLLSIDLVQFHRGRFWHLRGSVVRHFVGSKIAWYANSCLTRTLFFGLLWWSCKLFEHHRKESGLVAVQGFPHLCLWRSCTVPSASILSRMRAIINLFGGSVLNSRQYCLCTSHTFSNFEYHFNIITRCSNDSRSAAIFWLACHSIRWLWRSCDLQHHLREYRNTHYTIYFGSTLKTFVDNIY